MEPSRQGATEPWAGKDVPALAAARRAVQAVFARNTRFRLYFRMLDTPLLSELYVRGRGPLRQRRIQPTTRIVIEAFPSSGNTYCRQAFLLSNPGLAPDDICSHTHSPRIVIRAVKAGLPCIVVARDPRDAVSSTVQRFAGIHLDAAFEYYAHYYRRLIPLKDKFVVAPFTLVVSDFSSIIQQVNDKYGVTFATETGAGVSNDMVLEDIERRTRNRHNGNIPEATISRPSSSRKRSEEYLRDITDKERLAMEGALDAYRNFISQGPQAKADSRGDADGRTGQPQRQSHTDS